MSSVGDFPAYDDTVVESERGTRPVRFLIRRCGRGAGFPIREQLGRSSRMGQSDLASHREADGRKRRNGRQPAWTTWSDPTNRGC